ncbi:hypothetical protein [Streptomyces sp. NPDC003832]
MTTTRRSSRLLMLSTVLLTVAGIVLLGMPHSQDPPPSPTVSTAHRTTQSSPTAVLTPGSEPAVGAAASATAAAPMPSPSASALPPHGEGAAGDLVIQRSLQAAWPADLPSHDEQELLTAGRDLLRADATGAGRAEWFSVFGDSGRVLAPAFAAARFRIQAAVARRDGSPDRAVVHLVWAGTDRGGTYAEGRVTDWHFTRTIRKGAATWTVQSRI